MIGRGGFTKSWPLYLLLWARLPLENWSSPHSQQKSHNVVLGCNLKNDLSSFPRQIIQYHSNPSLCPNHWFWKRWSWLILWRPTIPKGGKKKKKDSLFIIGDQNAKVGSQEISRIIGKFYLGVQNEMGKGLIVLSGEYASHRKHPFPTIQVVTLHMDITSRSILQSDWLWSLQLKKQRSISCLSLFIYITKSFFLIIT